MFESATRQHQVSYCKEAEQACKTKTNLLALREERQIRSFHTCRWQHFQRNRERGGGMRAVTGKLKYDSKRGRHKREGKSES